MEGLGAAPRAEPGEFRIENLPLFPLNTVLFPGGRHRSVYLAERLAEAFRNDWNVLVRHRALLRDGDSA